MSESANGIRIVAISGSVRPGNYTGMALDLVIDELRNQHHVTVDVVHPETLNLPLPGLDPKAEGTRKLQEIMKAATGVVLATPEYHGSFSSVMKLVIENLGFPSSMTGKPVALLGVAAGAIGAIKSLEQLRGVCAHIGALALPLPVSVANVQKVFDPSGRCLDPGVEKLVRSVAGNLMSYIHHSVCPAITLERILRGEPAHAA